MRAVNKRRNARSISLALVAGLLAFEAVLVSIAGAVGIPGLVMLRLPDRQAATRAAADAAMAGGESFVAKLSVAAEPVQPEPKAETPKPASAASQPAGEPNLQGLADIPLKPWIPEKPKVEEAKPGEKGVVVASASKEALPWDAVEPYLFSSEESTAAAPGATGSLPAPAAPEAPRLPTMLAALPAASAVEGWVKAKASEIKGEERGRALYHFEFWLDAPAEVKRRLVAVAYEFNTPAVMPQAQVSSEEKTGFRISAGGLTCADKVTVTLKFNDGQKQQVAVDGCRLVDSA
jgi:hypothetical protein